MTRAEPPTEGRAAPATDRHTVSRYLVEVLSPAFLMVLGIVVIAVWSYGDVVTGLVRGAALAFVVGWLPHVFLPIRTTRSRARSRAKAGGRSVVGILVAALCLGVGIGLGAWSGAPRSLQVFMVTLWVVFLMTSLVSRWWSMCPQSAVAAVLADGLILFIGPRWSLSALVVVVVATARVRAGQQGPVSVVIGAVVGAVAGAAMMIAFG